MVTTSLPPDDTVISTTNKPRRCLFTRHIRGIPTIEPAYLNSVRTFRISAETVHLQIRMERDYAVVALTPDETWRLIRALIDALPPERKEV